jgi:predicted small secreted protein
MKKKIILPLVLTFSLVAAATLLTACSRQGTGTAGSQTTAPAGRDRRRPDFGQPEKQPDIRGVVKSVTGNAVTILKIDLPNSGRKAS